MYVLLKESTISLQFIGRLLIQWVLGIGFQEQILQSIHDGIDGEHGFPILAQNVQAHVSVQINIRMIHLGQAFGFGRFVRVIGSDLEAERESTPSIEAFVGRNEELEIEKVVGIGEFRPTSLGQLEFIDILGDSQLGRRVLLAFVGAARATPIGLIFLLVLQREQVQHDDDDDDKGVGG